MMNEAPMSDLRAPADGLFQSKNTIAQLVSTSNSAASIGHTFTTAAGWGDSAGLSDGCNALGTTRAFKRRNGRSIT